jgi:hypothetical protein
MVSFITYRTRRLLLRSLISARQSSSIATMRLPGQDMHLLHPLDASSIKYFTSMQTLSLMAVFRVAVGPAMVLAPASERFLTDPDTGMAGRELSKLFNEQLRSLKNLRDFSAQRQHQIDKHWAETFSPDEGTSQVGLSSWNFDMLAHSMGTIFWCNEGPFEERFFREQLRYLHSLILSPGVARGCPFLQSLHSELGSPAQPRAFSHPTQCSLGTRLHPAHAQPSCCR